MSDDFWHLKLWFSMSPFGKLYQIGLVLVNTLRGQIQKYRIGGRPGSIPGPGTVCPFDFRSGFPPDLQEWNFLDLFVFVQRALLEISACSLSEATSSRCLLKLISRYYCKIFSNCMLEHRWPHFRLHGRLWQIVTYMAYEARICKFAFSGDVRSLVNATCKVYMHKDSCTRHY